MKNSEQLTAQAAKARRLALGLSNRDDVRTLEALANELEERARASMFAGSNRVARPAGFEPAT